MDSNKNDFQQKFWQGEFGDNYIERNKSIEQVNELYLLETGISVESIFQTFFNSLDRDLKILELGCNIGLNLSILLKMGFSNLSGIEINKKAYEIAKKNNPTINFINTSIETFETKDNYDLVFTAGVLIHISPSIIPLIIQKIDKLSQKYIFGFEYFSDKLEAITYHNNLNTCWKQNYPKLIKDLIPSSQIVMEQIIKYKNQEIYDVSYLIKK